ncbi:MAG: cell wall-binding repeat-containing protein [Solirubrobacterales bacterium]
MPGLPTPSLPNPPSLWSDTSRRIGAAVAVLAVAAIGFGVGYLAFGGGDDDSAPAPTVVVEGSGQTPAIAFPTFATRNTTRIGGADPTADAAGVALASYPTGGGVDGPNAVVLASVESWQEALAATPLVADPVGAPILLSEPDAVPDITAEAIDGLQPRGLSGAQGAQVVTIGKVAAPPDLVSLPIEGVNETAIADQVDSQLTKLTGEEDPGALVVVSSTDAPYAMPAASWAARSGDPILFADGDEVPESTLAVVKRHPDTPIYVLGPESVISDEALKALGKDGGTVTRVGAEDPVENAITFARFVDGDFGWNINDPGHGFTIANIDRPLDAAAAAPLAATGGTPGPMLLTDDANKVPDALAGFLMDTQPGFVDDPSRAVFNRIWILGDEAAISVAFQAQVDQLTRLAPVKGSEADALPGDTSNDTGSDESEPGADTTSTDEEETTSTDEDTTSTDDTTSGDTTDDSDAAP